MKVSFALLVEILTTVLIQSSEIFGQGVTNKCYDLPPDFVAHSQCGEQFNMGTKADNRVSNSDTNAPS